MRWSVVVSLILLVQALYWYITLMDKRIQIAVLEEVRRRVQNAIPLEDN